MGDKSPNYNMNRNSKISLRFLAEPTDINFGGKVHGGAVMKWIDQAAYACAAAWSGMYAVTIYVGGIRFLKPIRIGELVELNARVVYTGRTSMHIMVDVFSCDPKDGNLQKTTTCIMVFVGMDENGKPSPVPKFEILSEEDQYLKDYAVSMSEELRKLEEKYAKYR